uniref:Uncharacterized protein n=1 Tax=Arundo donax TaxID=35708 RepID=A0A0A8YFD6_ARUDO
MGKYSLLWMQMVTPIGSYGSLLYFICYAMQIMWKCILVRLSECWVDPMTQNTKTCIPTHC